MTDSIHTNATSSSFPQVVFDNLLILPSDWRDKLLDYLFIWGKPEEFLSVVFKLQETPGATIHLLDRQAYGLAKSGNYADALEVIERRLRRSPAIAAAAFEATLLQAAGHHEHALSAANQLLANYARNVAAVTSAALILAQQGQFTVACAMLESLADTHPGNPLILLTLTEIALNEGDGKLADQYLQRLGIGVPAEIASENLYKLASLHRALGSTESARAAELELERRRQFAFNELQKMLDPLTELQADQFDDADAAYQLLCGPKSIQVSSSERRGITLDAIKFFGFAELREGQIETIATVLRGESILVIMPTGAGKSLCYQLPALVSPGTTLVISPLIALMKDQVENLPTAERRSATFINSTLSESELDKRIQGIAAGDFKLVYAAPERLRHRSFLRTVRNAGISLFVIDEAHCVSLWGHDFRPDYLFLPQARAELGSPPALAMTATAPPRVRDEILDYITDGADNPGAQAPTAYSETGKTGNSGKPQVLALDIFRDNLHLSAIQFNNEEEKLSGVTEFAANMEGSGIIYVNSRRKCESLAYALRQAGVTAEAYHAGLENRSEIQDRFMSDATRVIVATIAFGMGIDKSDIRFIVHFHPPRTLAAYYQEVGRAGRDGKPSQGLLFYSNNDWSNLRRWSKSDEYSIEFLERVYATVASQLGILIENTVTAACENDNLSSTKEITGPVDIRRIQQVIGADETAIRVAISILERANLLARDFDIPEMVEIQLPSTRPAAANNNDTLQKLLTEPGLTWGSKVSRKLATIATLMQWSLPQAELNLLELQYQGLLSVHFEHRAMLIHFDPQPEDVRHRLQSISMQSAAISQRRIDDVIGYATTSGCRHGHISAHLGSRPINTCQVCDNCTGIRPEVPEPAILPQIEISDDEVSAIIIDCLINLPKPVGRHGLARILEGALNAPGSPDESRHFGRLRGMGSGSIVNYIDDLLQAALLRQYDRNGYPLLAATLQGRNEAQMWRAEHPDLESLESSAEAANVDEEDTSQDGDSSVEPSIDPPLRYTKLQTAIWAWRRRTADQQARPAYTIMDNDVILAIAANRPRDLSELAAIPGIGAQRLERYGPVILDIVRLNPPEPGDEEILAAHQITKTKTIGRTQTSSPSRKRISPRGERSIFLKLQELRQQEAVREGCSSWMIASSRLLRAIAAALPEDEAELMNIRGFRSSGLRSLSQQICELVTQALRSETT